MNKFSRYPVSVKDPRFPSFQQGFNRRWLAGNCQAVYVCYDTAGAVAALNEAIQLYGKHVKIKSGGHCYENFVFNEGTLAVIDVSAMDGYGLDPAKGYWLGSGGTNWSAFNHLFRDYGKVLPAGSCYSVGLGGHICGGGYGLLSRLNGLTVDWLTGVEVVVKDNPNRPARAVYVSADALKKDELDLYWGHRGGGGGNFGLITKYYFRELPDAPASAFITSLSIDWKGLTVERLGELLKFFAQFSAKADNGRQFGILALAHKAHGQIALTVQTAVLKGEKPAEIKAKFIDPLFRRLKGKVEYKLHTKISAQHLGGFSQPDAHTILYTFYEAVQLLNGSGPNQRGKYKSAYMRKPFPPQQVATIFKQLQVVPPGLNLSDMSQCLLQVDSYGGRVNALAPDVTAIPQRSSILKLQYQAYWTDPSKDPAMLGWIRGFYTQMYKSSGGTPNPALDKTNNVDGCYYNYPDVDLNEYGGREGALQLYFGANLERLKAVKKRWDPGDYFNSLQSIG